MLTRAYTLECTTQVLVSDNVCTLFVLFNSKFTAVLMLPEGLHLINPLTTDDECTCLATLAACNQLAQSVPKIGFALAKKLR